VARIAGVDLPRDKRVEIGLTYIFGIGLTRSKEVLAKTGVNPDTRVKDLSEADVALLRERVEGDYQIEGDLRRWESMNIKRLVDIGSYRGRRHRMGLPAPMRGLVAVVALPSLGRKKLLARNNMVRWLWQPSNSQLAISSTRSYLPILMVDSRLGTPRQLVCLSSRNTG
jgi:small subunit ribosomal protein S13